MSLVIKEDSPLYRAVKSAEEGRRKFKGVWIPVSIWLNESLSWMEKCVWAEVSSLGTEKEPCFASNAYLAKMMRSSEGSIANILSDLKKAGLIKILSFDGRNRQMVAIEPSPTGEPCDHPQVNIDTIRDSKVSSSLHSEDTTSVLEELFPPDQSEEREARGAKPQPPTVPPRPPSPTSKSAAEAHNVSVELMREWNATCLPTIKGMTPDRRRKVASALKNIEGFAERWRDAIAFCASDPWRNGTGKKGAGHENWRFTVDNFLTERFFVRILEKLDFVPESEESRIMRGYTSKNV